MVEPLRCDDSADTCLMAWQSVQAQPILQRDMLWIMREWHLACRNEGYLKPYWELKHSTSVRLKDCLGVDDVATCAGQCLTGLCLPRTE